MKSKTQIINRMRQIARDLSGIYTDLCRLNRDGKQFDYVNCPELSDVFSQIDNFDRAIEKIIYQKTRKG